MKVDLYNPSVPAVAEACKNDDHRELKVLLNNGFDVDQADDESVTGIMYASQRPNSKCLPILIKNSAKINAQDDYGTTALMYAASSNILSAIIILLKNKADPDLRDGEGNYAITYAIIKDHVDAVKILLPVSLKNQKSIYPENALSIAVKHNSRETVQFLLESMSDSEIFRKDYQGKTVFDWANEGNLKPEVSAILENYCLSRHISTQQSQRSLEF